MIRAIAACFAVLAFADAASAAVVADTARETRWANEVVPQLVVGDAVWLATPRHPRVLALYTKAPTATHNAVIVVHGLGVNPDWNLIGVLRTDLAERGFATLSVQMPVLAADAARGDYEALFGDAGERLTAAVAFLHDNGYAHVAVVSHSLGAAMVNAWLATHDEGVVDAWVPIGMFVAFASRPREPVLDIVGERDFPDVLAAARMRAAQLPSGGCSASQVMSGADHYFGDAAQRLAAAIAPFLVRAFTRQC